MKRFTLLLLILGILVLSTDLVLAVGGSMVKVSLTSQSPDPVEPGSIVTLKFKIENSGAESTQDAIVKIKPVFPFSLYGDVAEKNIGKLRASTTGADAEILEYKLKVADDAVEKETEIELSVSLGETAVTYNDNEFLVNIESADAILDITAVTFSPEQIPPGGESEVQVTVKNLAHYVLKKVKLDFDFTKNDLPLAPYQSSSQRQISEIKSGYQLPVTFKIKAQPEATPGLYKIPLNITYYDENGNFYRLSDMLAVTVGEQPKVRAYIKKSTVQREGKNGLVTIEIANAGMTKLKFLEMEVLLSEEFELLSSSNYFYLGNLDSDDTDSQEVNLYVQDSEEGKVIIPVLLKYQDANNEQFQQHYDLELKVYSSYKLKKFGLVQSNNTWLFVFLIIVVVAGVFISKKKPQWIPGWVKKRMFWKKK